MTTAPYVTRTPPGIATLVMAASVGPLAMNVFLPSLPGMARYFSADYAVVQLAVSLYLAATALLQLLIGPASDRFGRRPVLLACFGIFLVATLAAIYAPTIEALLVCRVFQGFSAAGMVLARAVVRDTVETAEAASKIGYITMGMSVVPMVGPVIGGLLDELYGWQSGFVLTLVFGLVAYAIVHIDLGETNHDRTSSLSEQFRSYPELLRSRRFWGYTLTATFASGAFFAFLGGGPYVATEMLKLSPSQYGMYFGIISVGYMLGNFLSGRYSRSIGLNRMMLTGNVIACSGLALAMFLLLAGYFHALALFGPVFFVGAGNGMTLPNANAGIVSVKPHLAGSASGLGGALTIGGGAALSVLAGALLTPDSGPMPLLLVMFIPLAAAGLTTLYVIYVARIAGEI
ncbi:multidrug effflux MFS transporter [Allomesorhizobium camelthorni]|uniref:Bcr/CflA family efflux transporter n=1 Tax=Allomesorhizobium camelthorni TaxID=475069 RepID=A0A6G4WGW1_9HYPH|nr:multidrug effflux MFS transporter [Mesorhizobium camelthorni]NGO53433.1 multidrug effflux MFS transporter [Mesorhizobium camelthorni]